MSEAHLRKLMGENDVLKQKLEKQRKYTEELKKSVYRKTAESNVVASRNLVRNPLRNNIKTRKKIGKKKSFKQKKPKVNHGEEQI